jgi:hypothetical protein
MHFPYEEFDLRAVRTYPLSTRASKVSREQFAGPHVRGSNLSAFVARLPSMLAGADFKIVVERMIDARRGGRGIVWGLGGHVFKTGLSPILIDLMERGFVSAIATNGAGVIHDFEIALSGATSEDVDAALGPGRFGMAEETATEMNRAIIEGGAKGLGIGQAIGQYLNAAQPPHLQLGTAAAAARLGIPFTVHVAIGTDIIHMHPQASGAAIGEASLRDFKYFVSSVARLEGGVFLNCGSAVILPEVFLKAVAIVRNDGRSLEGLTTVNFDFLRQYRAMTNVVARPTAGVGRGIAITGHHELMIPLLAAALIEGLDE